MSPWKADMRIGITMRSVDNESYPEIRDAISRDWPGYIAEVLPEGVLIPLLNHPDRVACSLEDLRIDGLILSNGNDWGESPERDETETKLVSYCREREVPILGVCRGFQVLNILFGGTLTRDLEKTGMDNHIAVSHKLRIIGNPFMKWVSESGVEVNSYHKQGVLTSGLAGEMEAFAFAGNDVVEGFVHRNKAIIGIQWHPERANDAAALNRKLIKNLFKKGLFWKGIARG